MSKRKPKYRAPKYRVVVFQLAFRVQEPASIDLEVWQAQLIDVLRTAAQREEIPDEEFIVGYDPNQIFPEVYPADNGKTKAGSKPGIEGIVAISADISDKRTLKVHFDHDVADFDRSDLLAAVNQFILEY